MDEDQQTDQYGGYSEAPQPASPQQGFGLYGTETFEEAFGARPRTPKTAYTSTGQLTPHGRRVMRAQQEYDNAYKSWQNQQQMASQAYASQMAEQRAQRAMFIREATFARDNALKDQEDRIKAQMAGEVAEASEILKQVNPQDPNAGSVYSALAVRYPLAMRDEGFNRAMSVTSAVHDDYMQSLKAMEEQRKSSSKEQSAMLQSLYASGFTQKDIPKFMEDNVEEGRTPMLDPRKVAEGVGSKEYQSKEEKLKPDKASVKREYLAAKAEYDYVLANHTGGITDKEKMDAGRKLAEKKSNLLEFYPEVKDPSDLLKYAPDTDILLPDGSLKKVPQRTTTQTKP